MNFDWNKFITLANELRTVSSKAGTECRFRSVISRGYYGVFHLMRLALQKEGVKFNASFDLHQQVVQSLKTSLITSRKKLGSELGRLRQLRNRADYDDSLENLALMEDTATQLYTSIQSQIASGLKDSN